MANHVARVNQALRAIALIGLLLVGACGGGGGGGGGGTSTPPGPSITGNTLAPFNGPGDVQKYFPATAGDQWFYNATTDDATAPAPTSFVTVGVTGLASVLNVNATAFVVLDSSTGTSIDNYYDVSPGGISTVGNTDPTDTITPIIVPFADLLFPVQTGTVSALTGSNLPVGKDPAGNPLTLNVTQTIQNVDIEAVSVPAGNFPNAMKQVTTVNATVYDAATGKSVAASGTDTDWLAPGVGVVMETSTVSGAGTTIDKSQELRGYVVNGVSHGLGAPFQVEAGLAPAGSTGLNRSPAAVGYDGLHFAVAFQTISGSSPNYSATWNLGAFTANQSLNFLYSNVTGVVPQSSAQASAAIASNGVRFLVAIQIDTTQNGPQPFPVIVTTLFATDGSINPNPVSVTPGGDYDPVVGFDGTQYLLVYEHSPGAGVGQLYGLFVSAQTGQPVGSAFPITAAGSNKSNLSLAFDGTNYLVVWADSGTGGPAPQLTPGVYGARVAQTGAVLDSSPISIALQVLPSLATPSDPVAGFDGTNYLIAYIDDRTPDGIHTQISAARLSTAGVLLDGTPSSAGISVTTAPNIVDSELALAFIGGDYWLSWVAGASASVTDGLYGARLSTSGTLLSPGTAGFRMAPAGPALYPAFAGDTSSGLLTWTWAEGAPVSFTSEAISAYTINPAGP